MPGKNPNNYQIMDNFLKKYRVAKGRPRNFLNMGEKHNYMVPASALDLFCNILQSSKPKQGTSIIPVVSQIKTPIILDFDLRLKPDCTTPLSTTHIKSVLEPVIKFTKTLPVDTSDIRVTVFKRPRYSKKTKEYGPVLADGFHIYITNVLVSAAQLQQVGNFILQERILENALFDLPLLNPSSDVLDPKVLKKSSWPMLPGGTKTRSSKDGLPHSCVLCMSPSGDGFAYMSDDDVAKHFMYGLPEPICRDFVEYVLNPTLDHQTIESMMKMVPTDKKKVVPSKMECDTAPLPSSIMAHVISEVKRRTVKGNVIQLKSALPRVCPVTGTEHKRNHPYLVVKDEAVFIRCHSARCPGEKVLCPTYSQFMFEDDEPLLNTDNRDKYDHDRFMECLPRNFKPTRDQYLDIVAYLCSLQMVVAVCTMDKFNMPEKIVKQAARIARNARKGQGYRKVSSSTIKHIITCLGMDWKATGIWELPKYTSYNEYELFIAKNGSVFFEEDFLEFVGSVLTYISNDRLFVWKSIRNEIDPNGNPLSSLTTSMDKKAPWTDSDMFYINMWPTIDELFENLPAKKESNAERHAFLTKLKKKPRLTLPLIEHARKLGICIEPTLKKSSKFVYHAHAFGLTKRFMRMQFTPFLITNPTPPDTYNTFSGFPLLQIPPTHPAFTRKQFDDSIIGEWLHDVISAGNDAVYEYEINYSTFILQHPQLRAERNFVLYSEVQGIGKSSTLYYFRGLIGEELVCVCSELGELSHPFNGWQANKKIIFIDDTETASAKEMKKLKSRSTIKFMRYNTKNEKIVHLRCCDDIWFTTNQKVWLNSQDRRPVIIRVSDIWLNRDEKFDALYDAFQSIPCMKRVFDFFSQRTLPRGWEPRKTLPDAIQKHKLIAAAECMCLTHRFLIDFFSSPTFTTMNLRKSDNEVDWLGNYEQGYIQRATKKQADVGVKKGTHKITVLKLHLHVEYTRYCKKHYCRSAPRGLDQFVRELQQVNIEAVPRVMLQGRRRTVFIITKPGVVSGFQLKYGEGSPSFDGWVESCVFDQMEI